MSWIHRPLSSSREIAATKPKVKDIWAGLKEPQDDNTREWPKKASPRGFEPVLHPRETRLEPFLDVLF